MTARTSSGACGTVDTAKTVTSTRPIAALKTNPATMLAVSNRVGRAAESMALTDATLVGRMTEARARTSASRLTPPY
jgi:hypothetical protein